MPEKRYPMTIYYLLDEEKGSLLKQITEAGGESYNRICLSEEEFLSFPPQEQKYAISTLKHLAVGNATEGTLVDLQNGYGIWFPEGEGDITIEKVSNWGRTGERLGTLSLQSDGVVISVDNETAIPLGQYLEDQRTSGIGVDGRIDWYKISDLRVYLKYLQNNRYVAFFSVCGDGAGAINERINDAMSDLGLEGLLGKIGASYCAMVFHGKAEIEKADFEFISHAGECQRYLDDSVDAENELFSYRIESGGMNGGNWSLIMVDAVEYWSQEEGLNIVVYDSMIGKVVDWAHFNMDPELTCIRH